jgi:hypothetical protein
MTVNEPEDDNIPDEDSPAFEEHLPEEFDGDEEIEDDGSEHPYEGEDTHGSEEGEEE